MSLHDTPVIIDQDTCTRYKELWKSTVKSSTDELLQQSFRDLPSQNRMLALSFTMDQITQLVSVVGAHYIAARFLVDDNGRFTMAMYAADENYASLSSCYLAGFSTKLTSTTGGSDIPGQRVPDALAQGWITNWSGTDGTAPANTITRKMFDSSVANKPLEGYTFDIDDFLAMFPSPSQEQGGNLLVHFGLHKYSRPDSPSSDVPVETFGLILRRTTVDGGAVFYDMTSPCPPICG